MTKHSMSIYKFLTLFFFILLIFSFSNCNKASEQKEFRKFVPAKHLSSGKDEPGWIVVDFKDDINPSEIYNMGYTNFTFTDSSTEDEAIGRIWTNSIERELSKLRKNPKVELAEPEILYKADFSTYFSLQDPSDPLWSSQWNLHRFGVKEAWSRDYKGQGVIVAVLDTGVNNRLEDLSSSRILPGRSFVGEDENLDINGHGSHVAGTIAQSTNNGIGAAGVAPEASILPVQVLSGAGYGSNDGVAAGILWAVDNGAHIINMSLGGPYSAIVEKAVNHARANNVLVVAACGNSSDSECDFPGGLQGSIGVSAIGPTDAIAFYSSYGVGLDVAAPGGDKSTHNGGITQNTAPDGVEGYYEFQGTSMATPHVAGLAALIASTGVPPADLHKHLLMSVEPGTSSDYFGAGIVSVGHYFNSISPPSSGCCFQDSPSTLNHPSNFKNFLFVFILTYIMFFGYRKSNPNFVLQTSFISAFFINGFFFFNYFGFENYPLLQFLTFSIFDHIQNLRLLFKFYFEFPDFINQIPFLVARFAPIFFVPLTYLFAIHKHARPFIAAAFFSWIFWIYPHAKFFLLDGSMFTIVLFYVSLIIAIFFPFGIIGVDIIENKKKSK